MSGRPRQHDGDRFWRFIDGTNDTFCWLWTGGKTSDGYGIFHPRVNGEFKSVRVHRYVYEEFIGPIPEGLQLDHLCRNRACCNPDHLEAVTNRENTLRGDTIPARNAAKTHCVHGHPFDEENTYVEVGRRSCRTCRRTRSDTKRRAAA